MSDNTTSPGSPGSFSAFWQKSVDKVSFRSVKFMPNNTTQNVGKIVSSKIGEGGKASADDEGKDASGLTAKQRRRAQVRKAQIEHRQRKENYVKHLEQDVINLREMIAQAETQSVIYKFENEDIKHVLKKANVLVPASAPLLVGGKPTHQRQPSSSSHQETFEDFMDFCMFSNEPQQPPPQQQSSSASSQQQTPQPHQQQQFDFSSPSSPEAMLVSTTFDEWIDSTVLQISSPAQSHASTTKTMIVKNQSPRSTRSSVDQYNGTDIYNFPNAFSSTPHMSGTHLASTIDANQSALANLRIESSLSKPLPRTPREQGLDFATRYFQNGTTFADFSTLAINFILALEHPCRTHFHPSPNQFIPTAPHSGHELMASTLVYHTAPTTIYSPTNNTPTENASWTAPSQSLELKQLWEMSRSLPKGDWEITPVQGWFMLIERYGIRNLLTVEEVAGRRETTLDRLKRGLGKLTGCFSFGAVIDAQRFWEVVESEIGLPPSLRGIEGKGKGKI